MFGFGGSYIELIWLRTRDECPQIIGRFSIPHGVVNLSERYGKEAICECCIFDRLLRKPKFCM